MTLVIKHKDIGEELSRSEFEASDLHQISGHVLDAIDDVDVPSPTDGYALTYDSASGLWIASAIISDDAYGAGWDGVTTIAPSKNAVYDKVNAHENNVDAHHTRYTDAEAVTAAKTVKLDDLAAPDDTTDLDASTAKHGLLKKLPDDSKQFLDGTGTWQEATDIDPAPASDHKANGLTTTMTAGESLVFGEACYMKSDGKLWKADADAASTMPVVAIALGSISADATGSFLFWGFARDDTWAWTVGGIVYASCTAGALTQTAPSATGDQVQVVGIATHADRLYFNPSLELVEVS